MPLHIFDPFTTMPRTEPYGVTATGRGGEAAPLLLRTQANSEKKPNEVIAALIPCNLSHGAMTLNRKGYTTPYAEYICSSFAANCA